MSVLEGLSAFDWAWWAQVGFIGYFLLLNGGYRCSTCSP